MLRSSEPIQSAAADLDRYLERAALVPGPGRGCTCVHCLLLAGVRHHRGAAAVLRRPGHPGRRPPEGRVGPGRAADRRWACSTRRAISSSPSPGTPGSRKPIRCWTRTACRLTLLREPSGRRDGRPLISLPLPNGRRLRAHVWRADVGRVPLLLLDSNVPGNDDAARGITDRLYGGGGDHRLQQELLLGMGGVKALRASPAAHGHAGARGVPHQRRPRRLPGHRTHPGADGRRDRR